MDDEYRESTGMILEHLGDDYGKYLNAVVPPVFMNSLHVYPEFEGYRSVDVFREDSFVYGRDGNPTVTILEKKIAALEHGSRAVVFASGMAAFTAALFGTCKAGSHIICMRDVYMPIKRFFNAVLTPRLNMTVTYVSGEDLQEIEDAVTDHTDLMILESPATFVFKVVDLQAISEIARRRGFKTYIDNSALTPVFQNPLDLGIDICMHTMSKYFGGHSDIIGGVLISKDEQLMRSIQTQEREFFGGIMGPAEAWLVIRGLRTLEVRMYALMDTGMAVAHFLEDHPKVERVYYTGLDSHPQAEIIRRQQRGHGSLMSFELVNEDPAAAVTVIDSLKLFGKGCSWGGFESLALLPLYDEPEESLALIRNRRRGLIRIYCGLEGKENLIADLSQALEKI